MVDIWNSLLDEKVNSDTIITLKRRFHSHMNSQGIKIYGYNEGTGQEEMGEEISMDVIGRRAHLYTVLFYDWSCMADLNYILGNLTPQNTPPQGYHHNPCFSLNIFLS